MREKRPPTRLDACKPPKEHNKGLKAGSGPDVKVNYYRGLHSENTRNYPLYS